MMRSQLRAVSGIEVTASGRLASPVLLRRGEIMDISFSDHGEDEKQQKGGTHANKEKCNIKKEETQNPKPLTRNPKR
jgi:hypothetical protein